MIIDYKGAAMVNKSRHIDSQLSYVANDASLYMHFLFIGKNFYFLLFLLLLINF